METSYDNINPSHYKNASIETIDMMVRIWGPEAVATHCEITAFKYRSRIGSKPGQSVEDELGKIKWYEDKAKELRGINMKLQIGDEDLPRKGPRANIPIVYDETTKGTLT